MAADEPSPRQPPTDEALVALVALGDTNALTALYDRYARPVYVMAAHMLGAAEADDVVQNAFLQLWTRAERFHPERGSFRSWFMALAHYRILDELRRRSHEQRFAGVAEVERVLAGLEDPVPELLEALWQRERSTVVFQALRRLPEEQRRVLILAYFGGCTQAAMARHLDVPLGTVKKRVRLGMQKLRSLLSRAEFALEEPAANALGAAQPETAYKDGAHELR